MTQWAQLESGFVQVGRLRVHHTRGGSGRPALLFVHGLGSSGYLEWRFNLAHFAAHHLVLAPDLPGFGRTDKPRTARYGVPYFARTLDRYLDAVGIKKAVVIGTSMGGRVALDLALEFGHRVERLVLVNSLGLGRPQVQFFYPLMMLPRVGEAAMSLARTAVRTVPPGVIRRWASRYSGATDRERTMDDAYLDQLREMFGSEGFAEAYLATVRSMATPAALAAQHDLTRRLSEIRVPVQLIWGAADPLFPLAHAHRAHAALPGSRLAVIEGVGHTPQADRPDEFNRILTRFLAP